MKTLAQLQTDNLRYATCESVGLKITSDVPGKAEDAIAKADDYFCIFLPPQSDGQCVQCGAVQGGVAAAIMGGGFQYGMVHGEGHCGTCHYPARAIHHIEGVGTLEMLLQYHPNLLESKPSALPQESGEGGES